MLAFPRMCVFNLLMTMRQIRFTASTLRVHTVCLDIPILQTILQLMMRQWGAMKMSRLFSCCLPRRARLTFYDLSHNVQLLRNINISLLQPTMSTSVHNVERPISTQCRPSQHCSPTIKLCLSITAACHNHPSLARSDQRQREQPTVNHLYHTTQKLSVTN
jgi:hypothetical protein